MRGFGEFNQKGVGHVTTRGQQLLQLFAYRFDCSHGDKGLECVT